MELLLNRNTDFADYADLPESLDMDRMRPHILAVQRKRLRPILTAPLLTELLLLVADERAAAGTPTPDPLTGAWATLRGLAMPVVACAALARYTPFSQGSYTSHSLVRKTNQYSEPVESKELGRMASVYDSDAISFEAELRTWLRANAGSFGGFYPAPSCCGAGQPGRTPTVVVQVIDRPDEGPYPYRR